MGHLTISIDNLLKNSEGHAVEYKSAWSIQNKDDIIKTISAFANDCLNRNGGYIVIGVEDANGSPVFPVKGIPDDEIERSQNEIIGDCKKRITPEYIPVVSVEEYEGKKLIVIWSHAGDNRPYQFNSRYYTRPASCTIEVKDALLRQLLESASRIPFDSRKNLRGTLGDISPNLVRKFLQNVNSSLVDSTKDDEQLYRDLDLLVKINSHFAPKNIALLFFNASPHNFFACAKIEMAQFSKDGDKIEEKTFTGPTPEQIISCLQYLNSLSGTLNQKVPSQAETDRTILYPYEALREAIVNALYHRSYEVDDPVKICLYPDRMEITSYPGPVQGLTAADIQSGNIPQLPQRNRRVGELLRSLKLAEGWKTGIPKIKRKMRENGSPDAVFDFADNYFRVTLPAHPKYLILNISREAAQLWAEGYKDKAVKVLSDAIEKQPSSTLLTVQLIEYLGNTGDIDRARLVLETFDKQTLKEVSVTPYLSFARMLSYVKGDSAKPEVEEILAKIPVSSSTSELLETAILRKRVHNYESAHRLLEKLYKGNSNDAKIAHELAQTKIELAKKARETRQHTIANKLFRDALDILRRVIQLSNDTTRKAWAWYNLAYVLDKLREPSSDIDAAYREAMKLLPEEARFKSDYEYWDKRPTAE